MPADELDRMHLCGYVQLADHGLALPAYRVEPGANAWYSAVATVDGDHASTIERFELLEDEPVDPLRDSGITVGPGDPWQDVFLWAGRIFAGQPNEILTDLEAYRGGLLDLAPLSYLDLAVAADSAAAAEFAAASLTFLERKLGSVSGAAAFTELVLRPGILIELRRRFRNLSTTNAMPDHLRHFTIHQRGPSQHDIKLAAGTSESVGGVEAAEELGSAVTRFGNLLGMRLAVSGLVEDERARVEADQFHAEQELPLLGRNIEPRQAPRMAARNILIIAGDQRSQAIARHIEFPSRIAFNSVSAWEGEGYKIERASGLRVLTTREESSIVISNGFRSDNMDDLFRRFSQFDVVVWLASNDALSGGLDTEISELVNRLDRDVPFLIAPAPPADGPSVLIDRKLSSGHFLRQANSIIDTTLARSPFWSGQPRRSIDRRMADIVATVCIAAATNDEIRTKLLSLQGSKHPYAVAFSSGSARSDIHHVAASELNGAGINGTKGEDDLLKTSYAFEITDQGGKTAQNASLEICRLTTDFKRFGEAAVAEVVGRRGGRVANITLKDVPEHVRESLDAPELAVAMKGEGSMALVVTAEAPGIATLREAQKAELAVIRYTDTESLHAAVEYGLPSALPAEVRLPKLSRLVRNRGLATRGVDTRDVLRIPENAWRDIYDRGESSTLADQVRLYRPAVDGSGSRREIVLPVAAILDGLRNRDEFARKLLQTLPELNEQIKRSGKRTGDLIAAWSTPAPRARRWIVEDGRFPVETAPLWEKEVPAQRLFFLDGDGAVPCFLASRAFSVWARTLLPTSTSWASRFQVSKTFDAFPFPLCFEISTGGAGSPPQLHFADSGSKLAELGRLMESEMLNDARQQQRVEKRTQAMREREPLIREIDRLLLKEIKLSPEASDLDVLEVLVERNRGRF